MSNEPRLQEQEMIQAALDGQLSEEMAQRLVAVLERDAGAAQEYSRLQRIDALLRRAPHERAPARLAATVMARVAARVEAEAQLADLPEETQRVMMLFLSAAMMAMMPMMEAAFWLVLNARRDPEVLSDVMIETISWMSLATDALIQLLEDAERRARNEPVVATATLALTPYVLSCMLDFLDELPVKQAAKL